MKAVIIATICGLMIAGGLYNMVAQHRVNGVPTPVYDSWVHWKMRYGKSYGTNSEEQYRLNIFAQNFDVVKKIVNGKGHTWDAGMTVFADLTAAEFKKTFLATKQPTMNHMRRMNYHDLPKATADSVDWRGKAVTPVKDQGQCGSCWAFSTTGGLEGAYALKNNSIKSFSEQQLVDCTKAQGNQGCNGGLMDPSFTYVESNGIELESDYPYTGRDGDCKFDHTKELFKVSQFVDVKKTSQDLKDAVATRPVSIAVDAQTWQFYMGGIFNGIFGLCGSSLDHGVLAVGYGADGSNLYWTFKNSWGASWGEHGFIRVKRVETGAAICAMDQSASYPMV